MKIYILYCDLDGGTHGCFDSKDQAVDATKDLIKTQPFHMKCDVGDFYLLEHELNTRHQEIMIDLNDLIKSE